jgi:6,7-dimethyl-8-ribityllumazine synthase
MRATPSRLDDGARATGLRFVVLGSRFNGEIVEKLVDGAVELLVERGAARADVEVIWGPGALELPLMAKRAIESRPGLAGVVCLGCVIQGGTDHYEHVCRATVDGLMRVSIDTGVPVGNGVLTVATLEQALERAGGTVGNKGAEAAAAALEVAAAFPTSAEAG